MLLRVQDLEPQVFHAVMAAAGEAFAKPDQPESLRRLREEDSRRFQPNRLGCAAVGIGSPLLGFLAAGLARMAELPGPTVALAGMGAVSIGLLGGGLALWRSWRRMASVLHSDLLAALLPHIELEPAERAYCEALVLLSKPDLRVEDATARQFLADLNDLMKHFGTLGAARQELERLLERNSSAQIAAERAALSARVAETADQRAQEDLAAGLRLCEDRLENSQVLEQARQRLEAQQERVLQTLASIQSTLARLDAAREALTEPTLEDIRHRLQDATADAVAQEAAVQEVLALRSP